MKVQKSVTKKVMCVNKGQGTLASTEAPDHLSFHIAGRKRWRRKREAEKEKKMEKLKWGDKRENNRLKRRWGKEWLRVWDKGRQSAPAK